MAAKKKSLWKKSKESVDKLLPAAQAEAVRRQRGADKSAKAIKAKSKKKAPKKAPAKPKSPLMKGKINRTKRSK